MSICRYEWCRVLPSMCCRREKERLASKTPRKGGQTGSRTRGNGVVFKLSFQKRGCVYISYRWAWIPFSFCLSLLQDGMKRWMWLWLHKVRDGGSNRRTSKHSSTCISAAREQRQKKIEGLAPAWLHAAFLKYNKPNYQP